MKKINKILFSVSILIALTTVYLLISVSAARYRPLELPTKSHIPPLIALGFTPAEIREQYMRRQTETTAQKKRKLEDKTWEYEGEGLSFRVLQNGIVNPQNTLTYAHVGNCSFQIMVFMELAASSKLSVGDRVSFYMSPKKPEHSPASFNLTITNIFEYQPEKRIAIMEGSAMTWESFQNMDHVKYLSMRPSSYADFNLVTEKWNYDLWVMTWLNIEDATGCKR